LEEGEKGGGKSLKKFLTCQWRSIKAKNDGGQNGEKRRAEGKKKQRCRENKLLHYWTNQETRWWLLRKPKRGASVLLRLQ